MREIASEGFLPVIPPNFEEFRHLCVPETTTKIAHRTVEAIQVAGDLVRAIVGARHGHYHDWLCRLTHALMLGLFSFPSWDRNGLPQDFLGMQSLLYDVRTPDPGYWLRTNGTTLVRGDKLRVDLIKVMARMANGEEIPPFPALNSEEVAWTAEQATLWQFQRLCWAAERGLLIDCSVDHPRGSHGYMLSDTPEGCKSQMIVAYLGVLVQACHSRVDPFGKEAKEAEAAAVKILTTILEAVTEKVPRLAPRPWGWNNPLWHASFQRLCELVERMC